jgi:dipeptidyl aminopeptidase/acylaminoacyl peptidase
VDRGIADRDRIGVGGHSYGGFMTANLLAHSRMFRAGIARSAAHNRTLTPFGFQNERRTLWEAPDVYMGMSPFMFAHEVEDPLLIIHGADDANPGTFPVQSERMFHALKGHGKEARLVMLDYEDHGYGARESIFHTLWEMIDWFNRHVRDAAGQTGATGTAAAAPPAAPPASPGASMAPAPAPSPSPAPSPAPEVTAPDMGRSR